VNEVHNVNYIHKRSALMTFDPDELVGLAEVAEMAKVSRSAAANWRARSADFPKPVAELHSGPVFLRRQIRKWLRRRKVPMTTVTATINLKGGVGKSTTTVAIGEMLAAEFRKRVLIIDLDPQTNATTMLIGEDRWKELNESDLTLAQLFKDSLLEDVGDRKFDLENTLQRSVSNVRDVRGLDLLPSSLDLIEVQDRLGSMSSGRFYSDNPTDILRRATRRLLDEEDYDYVLIDCPPNLGIITLNGLRISGGYIIPTIPDVLSTYGIPQIMTRVQAFADNVGEQITPFGIVVSKYREQSGVHQNTLQRLRAGDIAPEVQIFDTIIPENNQIASSAEFLPTSTLRQKYGYQGQFDRYRRLTEEFMEAVDA
jgi:chromosome partitioning protein